MPRKLCLKLLALAPTLVGLAACAERDPQAEPRPTRMSLAEAMAPGALDGFASAVEPRPFSFPRDHGAHPAFQIEWWYFTGNLEAHVPNDDGRRFGYQLTFFRSALQPPGTTSEDGSAWRTDQLFMAHLAITDRGGRSFHAFERFSRRALGLAGVEVGPFRVWLEDWSAESAETEALFPLTLRAWEEGIGLELSLATDKAPVLQGDAGLSRKGQSPGNASYYYSFTRLPTRGTLTLGGETIRVEGSSWLDREWSTSALEPGVVGWDWFALQLADGRELMFYRLRRDDGSSDPASGGSIVEPDGAYRVLSAGDVTLAELDTWRSPETGALYPSRWRLTSASADLDLEVTPVLSDQEHTGTVLYWEGAVDASGTSDGKRVAGHGYVELTGYEGPGSRMK